LDIIARINGRLVGVQFFIDHEYAKYGHRTVERYGEHVNCKPMERGYLLELVPKNRLTKEELEEYETLRQNTVNIAERRLQIEKEKRHKKYLELKKEFE